MGVRTWYRQVAVWVNEGDREPDSLSDQAARAFGAKRIWPGWAWALCILATAHLIAVTLYITDRATFQGIPPSLLDDLSDNPGWIIAHAAAAVGLIVSLARGPGSRSWACNVSSAFLASWSMLLLLVGLSVERGVSLLGPAFGLLLAVSGQILAQRLYAEAVIREAAQQARSQLIEED